VGKNKLRRFADNATFPNMFQRSYESLTEEGFEIKGCWNKTFFKNSNPIVLELACGKGEYTVALARRFPEKNFIGLDIKGARMWKGCKEANALKLNNTAFIRTKIELIAHFFGPEEIQEIWITFPDPHLRKSRRKKRLTSPQFLQRFKPLLKPGGLIHLKTDDQNLFDYTHQVILEQGHDLKESCKDVYACNIQGPVTEIQTFYEQIWLEAGKPIKYVRFSLNNHIEHP